MFANGVRGPGPLQYQEDVFDDPPGTPGYSPLRALNLVRWNDKAAVRKLESAGDVLAAERNGEVTVTRPGVVINMPLLTWPGGHR